MIKTFTSLFINKARTDQSVYDFKDVLFNFNEIQKSGWIESTSKPTEACQISQKHLQE